jgi:hypothetical protein
VPVEKVLSYVEAASEDRCARRISLSIDATIICNGQHMPVVITDLATAGFSAEMQAHLPLGARCWLKLPNILPLSAVVTRRENRNVGCSFNRLFDPEIFNQLLSSWQAPLLPRR